MAVKGDVTVTEIQDEGMSKPTADDVTLPGAPEDDTGQGTA